MSSPATRMDGSAILSRHSPRRSHTYHYEDDRPRTGLEHISLSLNSPLSDASSPAPLSPRGPQSPSQPQSHSVRSPSPSPSPATSPNARFTHSVPHSPIPREGSERSSGTPPKGPAVLIPTDRPIDELLQRWMGRGRRQRFRVDCEVRLVGYGLWTNRDWFVLSIHSSVKSRLG
jgi:hypothetical protein